MVRSFFSRCPTHLSACGDALVIFSFVIIVGSLITLMVLPIEAYRAGGFTKIDIQGVNLDAEWLLAMVVPIFGFCIGIVSMCVAKNILRKLNSNTNGTEKLNGAQ